MKLIFLSVFLCFVAASASANAQQDNGDAQLSSAGANAPAGFAWGETKQQIESKGIAVKDCLDRKLWLACGADSAPKEISFVKEYKLIFIEGHGLKKIRMYFDTITDDLDGHRGKQLYDVIKQNLISKYGQPKSSYENIRSAAEYDDLYQCLAYTGCSNWVSYWSGEGGISLEINGLMRGVCNIVIDYESKDFSAILEAATNIEAL